jgi:hypothetical protein
VIERCIVNLLYFAGLLFVVLFGFAVALHIGYGRETDVFSSIRGALVAVLVAPAGGVDFSGVFEKEDTLGPVLIMLYIILIVLLLLNTFMAICVDTYSVCTFELNEVKQNGRGNPTAIFLWTYFNALKGVKLVGKESDEDKGEPDEQQIVLSSLPEAVTQKYIATKQRMEAILAEAEGAIEERRLERLRELGQLDSTTSLGETKLGTPGNLMLTDQDPNNPMPPPPLDDQPPLPSGKPDDMMVNRVQLQRMLEDDEVLKEVCGTHRAIDVVRRFRVDKSDKDPYQAVAELQKFVAEKLKELEKSGYNLNFDELETLRTVSSELHAALTESQKEWRAELLTVTQMAALLSQALIELTRRVEQIQLNHNNLATRVG